MYGHELFMSLETRAKLLPTNSTTSVYSVSDTLWSETFLFDRIHNDDRVKLLLKVVVVLLKTIELPAYF
jgi:hypothetical protein